MKLVACDVDGTLLRDDNTVSPATRRAVARATRAGVDVLLVTGRPVRTLHEVLGQLPITSPVVVVNGAAVYDPVADVLVTQAPIGPVAVDETVRRVRHRYPEAVFAAEVDGGRWLSCEPGYPLDPSTPWSRRVSAAALGDQSVSKLLVKVRDEDPDTLLGALGGALAGIVECAHSRCPGLLEVTAAGVTKATALAQIAGAAGIAPEYVVAIGDMPNDLPMLAWAGYSVAMANAHPSVLAQADQVTASNDDDGVARYLDGLLCPRRRGYRWGMVATRHPKWRQVAAPACGYGPSVPHQEQNR